MMGEPLRVLNEKGIEKFREYLNELREGSTEDPPRELFTDPWFSSKMPGEVKVEKRTFANKQEAAKYLFEIFHIFPHSQIDQNIGLWSWLSLYYFDEVCPKNKFGKRIPGRDCRHILDLDYRRYYYHLLTGPYNIYKIHGEKAPLLLYGPLYETGKYYLELSARQGFITNKGIIHAANLLYFDAENGKQKRGAAVTSRKPGVLIRFIDVVQQLDLTYDLHSMTGEEIVSLLPPEFDEWRKGI